MAPHWLPLLLLLLAGAGAAPEGGASRPAPPPAAARDVSAGGGAHGHVHPGGVAYDHVAFLGAREAPEWEELLPEESRRRLRLLVPLIDADADGSVSVAELGSWVGRRRSRSLAESVAGARGRWDRDGDGRLRWDEYRGGAYGDGDDFGDTEDPGRYRRLVARDERRFRAADGDGDGVAAGDELAAFLQPEAFERMAPVVAAETLEDMDKDGDGFVQVDEYIADLHTPEPGQPEPEWVRTEREQFSRYRDLDGDGRLDAAEVAHWLRPPAADPDELEAKHLVHEADSDKDGALSADEILSHWDLFVGSQATSYGHDLARPHDEL